MYVSFIKLCVLLARGLNLVTAKQTLRTERGADDREARCIIFKAPFKVSFGRNWDKEKRTKVNNVLSAACLAAALCEC